MTSGTGRRESGFTLMEVLVALVITGFTVTVFFQLLSASLLLERKSRVRTEATVAARQIVDRLLARDMREDDFPWQGEDAPYGWTVTMDAVALQQAPEDVDPTEGVLMNLLEELYAVNVDVSLEGKPFVTLSRYRSFPRGHFTETFQDEYVNPVPLAGEDEDDQG